MCRMIAAVGEVSPRLLLDALRCMAANDNPVHSHERRPLGVDFRHEHGWGVAWVEDGELRVHRRTQSILEDRTAERTVARLEPRLLFLHARRASRGTPRMRNTHPFNVNYLGRDWAFCHNGTIDDHWVLQRVPGLVPQGGTDSEHLFHHLLSCVGARYAGDLNVALAAGLADGISRLRTYTAAHCFLASTDRIVAIAARHAERSQPGYHSLWEGCRSGLRVVSSEPVDGLGCTWERLTEPAVVTMEVTR
jgi:predicted glutamine amidotransferase